MVKMLKLQDVKKKIKKICYFIKKIKLNSILYFMYPKLVKLRLDRDLADDFSYIFHCTYFIFS